MRIGLRNILIICLGLLLLLMAIAVFILLNRTEPTAPIVPQDTGDVQTPSDQPITEPIPVDTEPIASTTEPAVARIATAFLNDPRVQEIPEDYWLGPENGTKVYRLYGRLNNEGDDPYYINYIEGSGVQRFEIWLVGTNAPAAELRREAENTFIAFLKKSKEEACLLSVSVYADPYIIDKTLYGRDLGMSFCPGSVIVR